VFRNRIRRTSTRDQTIAATGPYLYQTFTVTEDSFLKTVTLYVEAISGSSLHAALLPGNDPSTTTVVSTAVIEDLGAVPGSQTFDFSLVDPPAELTAGESYGLRFLGATELGGAGNVYAGGMAYDSRISTTTLAWEPVALPDNDLYFSTVLTAKDSIMPALHVAEAQAGWPPFASHAALALTIVLFVGLAALYALKALRYPDAVAQEWRHPVKLSFFPSLTSAANGSRW